MSKGEYAVELVVDPHQLAEAFAVRLRVFVEEQGVDEEEEFDDDDFAATTTHAIVRDLDTGEVVGTARLIFPMLFTDPEVNCAPYSSMENGEAKIGRVAVLPFARQRGIGTMLMRALEQRALLSVDPVTIFLSAQVAAAEFYEKQGYQLIGAVYDDVGIPHRDAIKSLAS